MGDGKDTGHKRPREEQPSAASGRNGKRREKRRQSREGDATSPPGLPGKAWPRRRRNERHSASRRVVIPTSGCFSAKGIRPTMEDEHIVEDSFQVGDGMCSLYVVLDGHGGDRVARMAKRILPTVLRDTLLAKMQAWGDRISRSKEEVDEASRSVIKDTFSKVDTEIVAKARKANWVEGSTACCALLLGKRLYVANIGDSRAVLCRGGAARDLSVDHKPSHPDEMRRIQAAGGFVTNFPQDAPRVNGVLALSRAFGDVEHKVAAAPPRKLNGRFLLARPYKGKPNGPVISAVPDITLERLRPEDEFVVIACDGLWDVMESADVVAWVKRLVENGRRVDDIARDLVAHAMRCGSTDNVTVVIVLFEWMRVQQEAQASRRSPMPGSGAKPSDG